MKHLLATGIIALMILGTASWASAQDTDNVPPATDNGEPRRVRLNNKEGLNLNQQRVTLPGKTRERPYDPFFGYSEITLGVGGSAVVDRGDEYYTDSIFPFAQIGARHTGWSIGESVHLQLGLQAFGEGAHFESRTWQGSQWRAGGGLTFALFPLADPGARAVWGMYGMIGGSFEHEDGKSLSSTYRLKHQDTTYLNGRLTFELYPLILDDSSKRDAWGREIDTGWLPAVQLTLSVDKALNTDRQSTVTQAGFADPEAEKDRYGLTGVIYLRREATALGVFDWGLVAGAEYRYAAGYTTIKDGDSLVVLTGGLTARMQILPAAFLYLNTGASYELDTGRTAVYGTVSLQILEVFESIEAALRD